MKVLELKNEEVFRIKEVKKVELVILKKDKNNTIIEEGKGKLSSPFNFLK